MTSFKQEQVAESSPGSQCCDPLDSFIDYDQTFVPTPSISPLTSRSKSATPTSSSSSQQNTLIAIQPSPQTFAGPSHQYALYRQQAGLPVGALANTFAVNQVDQFGFGRDQLSYGMVPPSDAYIDMNTTDDFLDFGSAASQNSSGHMDLDFGSPTDLTMPNPDFVNPAAIAGQPSRSHPPQPVRVYPGMHQQAALAKAQAEAQRQQQQQQQQALAQQQPRTAPSHSRRASASGINARPATDPIVEQSISRLLNQMRHSSVASSNDDDTATPTNGGQSHGRSRKDEEDMDEDERLLASEEGKKLSGKERRQLRNKVSARAFRSRRKGRYLQLSLRLTRR